MNYDKIKIELEKRKITIKDFCRKIDITEQGFYHMIRNESMKVDVLERMSKALNVPVSFWFEEGNNISKEISLNKEIFRHENEFDEENKIKSKQIDTVTTELNTLLKSFLHRSE